MVDRGASLHVGSSSLNNKEEKTIRQSNHILDVQTANGIVVSNTHTKVYIKELGAYLWVHLVEDSPSVLPSGTLCNELGYSYSWPSGETPRLSKGKKVIECSMENFVLVVAVTKQKAVPSSEISSAKGNFEREQEVEDTMLDQLKPFTEVLIEQRKIYVNSKSWG